jgi:PEP-CTERM motif
MLILAYSAQASTIPVTFVGANTGVNDGVDYVLPYQLNVNGVIVDATCYDLFDNVVAGQSWFANALTLNQAAATGQFSSDVNAFTDYEKVGFLSEQTTSTPQNQIDLQHDIWNVFDPGTYSVTAGMQTFLDGLATSAFTNFNFNGLIFLEDANQSRGRAQAFVFDPVDPVATPEPGTLALMGISAILIGLGKLKRKSKGQA